MSPVLSFDLGGCRLQSVWRTPCGQHIGPVGRTSAVDFGQFSTSASWPKSKLAEVEIGRSRNWPKSKTPLRNVLHLLRDLFRDLQLCCSRGKTFLRESFHCPRTRTTQICSTINSNRRSWRTTSALSFMTLFLRELLHLPFQICKVSMIIFVK